MEAVVCQIKGTEIDLDIHKKWKLQMREKSGQSGSKRVKRHHDMVVWFDDHDHSAKDHGDDIMKHVII